MSNSKFWAWQLQGTIVEEKTKKGKIKKFLNPWTSLSPVFLRKKLGADILAVLKNDRLELGSSPVKSAHFPFWGLVFPKRSYLPPKYPHFQFWLLGKKFTPCLSSVSARQQKVLVNMTDRVSRAVDRFVLKNSFYAGCRKAIAINATPFSFIKNENGWYYGGGQSVRAFHLHFLLMPKKLKKVKIDPEKAPLVYPTEFSQELFELIFSKKKIGDHFFAGKKIKINITKRGVSFFVKGNVDSLISVLDRIDRFFYTLQLSMIFSFYQDSELFLEKLKEVIVTSKLVSLEKETKDLILLGRERDLNEVKALLGVEIRKLGLKYRVSFSETKIKRLLSKLILDKNGDLASYLAGRVVVLRPGMGYGCFAYFRTSGFKVHLSPLDSLFPEGVMESTGFIFGEKIKVNKKPDWLKDFLSCFDQGA